jgi:hypothetical protein
VQLGEQVTDLRIGEPVIDGEMCSSTMYDNILSS